VTVKANGSNNISYGIGSDGSVTINGGSIHVRSNQYGIKFRKSLTINGGQVTANGVQSSIYSYGGNIALGWTNPTDYIYANSYFTNGTLTLTKTFIDEDGNLHTPSNIGTIAGKTLYPEGVIMKHITGYGEGSGAWVFIASPVQDSLAPSEVHNLLGQKISTDPEPALYDFDLYRLNPSTTTWENYHAHTADFNLVNSMGYLYASKENRTLVFAGTYNTDDSKQVTLQQGWNLVGNPFSVEAYVNCSYYTMNAAGSGLVAETVSTDTPIPPCTGVVVNAQTSGNAIFSKTVPEHSIGNNGNLQIALSQVVEPVETPARNQGGPSTSSGTLALDNAIVSFNEGSELGKFYFGTQNANIYIPQNGKEYAIASVSRDAARYVSTNVNEIPVNFKAKENGTYTITVNPEDVEMAYLHLIDNLTGADIDFLPNRETLIAGEDPQSLTPSYTFTAKTTDYESRFKLVFAVGPSTGSGTFAFISNGNLIVNGEGMLQIMDMTGRMIRCTDVARNVSTSGMVPGVYVLRLINGENIRTQKMVIR